MVPANLERPIDAAAVDDDDLMRRNLNQCAQCRPDGFLFVENRKDYGNLHCRLPHAVM
jgi:hypothetical protein